MILYVNLDWIKNKNDFCQGGDIIDTVVFFFQIHFFVVGEFYDIPQKILCQGFHFQKEEDFVMPEIRLRVISSCLNEKIIKNFLLSGRNHSK